MNACQLTDRWHLDSNIIIEHIIVMEAKKSLCLYHPDQLITNFCKERSCLMPLCPSCIGEHTQYHEGSKSKPFYNSINETLAQVQGMIYNSIYALEQDKKRNNELIFRIESVGDLIRQRILAAKTMTYQLIDDAFVELQKDLCVSMAKLHEQIGLYSVRKSEKHEESIVQGLEELYKISEGLKTDKFLGNIIIFLKDKHEYVLDLHHTVSTYLQANENYQPSLEINSDAKTSLCHAISRFVKLNPPKSQEAERSADPRRRLNMLKGKESSQAQKTYTPNKSSTYTKTEASQVLKPTNVSRNSPYRDRSVRGFQAQSKDFKKQFQGLSKKVDQLKRENQNTGRLSK